MILKTGMVLAALLVLWTGFQYVANVHYHKLPDGTVVAHSHPYNPTRAGAPFQQHHHSGFEFLTIPQLSKILWIAIAALLLSVLTGQAFVLPGITSVPIIKYPFLRSYALRAPPLSF